MRRAHNHFANKPEEPQQARYQSPTGLLAVAAAMEKAGYEVILIDPQLQKDYEQKIHEEVNKGVLFAGMSVFVGLNILNARDLSRQIKSYSP